MEFEEADKYVESIKSVLIKLGNGKNSRFDQAA